MKQAKMISKQSQVFETLDKAMTIIAPIVVTGKKVTKREVDKANKALEGLKVSCWLSKGYISYFKLFAQDRSITGEPDEYGVSLTHYVGDYEKMIRISDDGSISPDEIKMYKSRYENMTESMAQKYINKYNKLDEKIKQLKDEQSKIPYCWMMR